MAYFALLFLILSACQSSVPSSSITTSAVNDLQGITKSIELIEKTTTPECKTDVLMVNLETLKARVESVDFAEMYNGVIYTTEEDLLIAKQDYVRAIRNQYLIEYVDGAVSNPLRWADMSQELKDMYMNYRKYLLDYTETENWWENLPKTLNEWKEK